jgi:YNFM family putative membrane transporter
VHLVPPSRHHVPAALAPLNAVMSLWVHLRDPGQVRLELVGALLMGSFVAVYNGVSFRLEAAPYRLGQAAVAAIFLLYPLGSVAAAMAGALADRVGRGRVLPVAVVVALAGVAVTTLDPLPLVIVGIALLTVGFFAAHSVASSWVGRRAQTARAQASALYLLAYYTGSTVAGPLGGVAWSTGGWTDVTGLAVVLLGLALVVSWLLRSIPPLTPAAAS